MLTWDLKLSIDRLPFKTNISFLPLIHQLKKEGENNRIGADALKDVLKKLEEVPELLEPSVNLESIRKNQELVDRLLNFVIPFTASKGQMIALTLPFDHQHFYCTPKFSEVIEDPSKELSSIKSSLDPKWDLCVKILHAYIIVLSRFYDFDLRVDNLFMYRLKDKNSGLEKYFKVDAQSYCVDIKVLGELKPLSKDEIDNLINKPFDLDVWLEILPLDNFEFYGFLHLDFVDVTELEAISILKTELLEKSSIINPDKLHKLENHVRSLLGLSNVKLGLIALNWKGGMLENRSELWNGFLCSSQYHCSDYVGSFYAKALRGGVPILLNDLTQKKNPTTIEQGLLDQGIRNVSVIPLFYENDMVGILELGSTKAGDINFTSLKKIREIIPDFSMAVKRYSDEMHNRIQAKIKEKCTTIHPSVEWRFEEAVSHLLQLQDSGENAKMEEIVFPEVYPLYMAIDIRNSSVERNKSIQKDLAEQLQLARNVLQVAFDLQEMPIYDYLISKIDKFTEGLNNELSTKNENNILNFLRNNVESLFDQLEQTDLRGNIAILNYKKSLDADLKIVNKRRKEFEDSLMMINDGLVDLLMREEEKAQQMFPHYFEKYSTDGVEHCIYMGQSLVNNRQFDPIYLKNLHMWQLMVTCELTRLTQRIKPHLPIPLDTTALILVHDQPLTIRFLQDEKKFNVDGAYNIRYEIIKKRIDKALVKNTRERLTQPGKLALIFSQESEMKEYRKYLSYLIEKGYFEEEVEELELEDLQGVYGLRALRLSVRPEDK